MNPQAETGAGAADIDVDVDIIGSAESDDDVDIINRDDVSNYNPENILPEPPEVISKIREWIAPTDYNHEGGEFQKHRASHMPGTGEWLFATPNYLKWHDAEDHGLLWIKGIPGSGKSVFAASLVDELAREGHPVLFFFFRQIIGANHKPINLLRDWLAQILEYSPPLQVQLKPFVDEKSENKRAIHTINIDDLWNYLKIALAHMPRAYLVADALDEMDKGNEVFLQALARLGSWQPGTVKVILTSRPVNTIEEPLRNIQGLQIRLEEKLVDSDISAYVQSCIESSTIPTEDRQLIKEAIPGRANGLFLYAKLAMDAFLEPNVDIRQVMEDLPADLNSMYTDLLREHGQRSEVPHDIQILILSWVTHATRPLRLLELAEFVRTTYKADDRKATIDIKAAKHLVRAACGPLLEILSDETVCVVHHSFTEFLNGSTRPHRRSCRTQDVIFPVLTAGATHECLAISCLRYLTSGCLDGLEVEKQRERVQVDINRKEIRHKARRLECPALAYAADNWHVHVLRSEGTAINLSATLLSHLEEFLSPGPRLDAWLDIKWRPEPTENITAYHTAARYGLTAYLIHLVSHRPEEADIDARDGQQQTPLFLAAGKGHAAAVKILLDAGADPDAEESQGLKPLHEAAKANHADVVRVLLEAGVSPLTKKTKEYPGRWCGNSPSSIGHTPLMYACEAGHLEALEAFMPYLGQDAIYKALDWALRRGRSGLVKRILQSPAIDQDNIITRGRPAFHKACQNADIESMEALLQLGIIPTLADLNLFLSGCSSAGQAYRYHPRQEELRVEDIKRGLDLFAVGGVPIDQCNPHLASKKPLLLRLLLQAGADPNAETEDGSTLLHGSLEGAAGWEIVTLLVEEGTADVNRRRRRDGRTPLLAQLADNTCDMGNCIRFIEQYLPDCSLTDNRGEGPLTILMKTWTPYPGEETEFWELAGKLVEKGAFVNQQDHSGKTAIHHAKFQNLALLVKLGADINAQDHTGKTRLMQMVGMGGLQPKQMDQILGFGARLDIRDFRGRTLLFESMLAYDCKKQSQYLIGLGLDPLVTDYSGNTLLHELAELFDGRWSPYSGDRLTTLTDLIALSVDPNASNHAGRTILHILCTKMESVAIFREILKCCNIESADHQGLRPIHLAAQKSEQSVFWLISAGADVSATTYQGKTPLHFAAEAGKSNIVGMLMGQLGKGKDGDIGSIIDATDSSGHTALYYACKIGRPETVSLLLGGAQLDKETGHMMAEIRLPLEPNPRYWNPQHYPRVPERMSQQPTSRLEEIVCMLMSHGLDFSNSKWLPILQEAIRQGRRNHMDYVVRCMSKLLPETSDADMDTMVDKSNTQQSPDIWEAFSTRWHEFREQSSTVAFSETISVSWPLAGKEHVQMEILMELLKQRRFDAVEAVFSSMGFDALLPSASKTPLHALVSLGYADILAKAATTDQIQILDSLESRQDVETPLIYAACERELPNMDVLRVLVERFNACCDAGPARRVKDQSSDFKLASSPLHQLAKGKHWWQVHQALPYLLSLPTELRPSLEVENSHGHTPLIAALRHNSHEHIFHTEAVRMLIEAGANVNATCGESGDNETCLSLAGTDLEMVRLLLKHGAAVTGSALAGAIERNDEELMGLLLSTGADPNMRRYPHAPVNQELYPRDQWYPLQEAAVKGQDAIVRQLLAHGADPFAEGKVYQNSRLPRWDSWNQATAAEDQDEQSYKTLTVLHEIIKGNGSVGPFFELLPGLDIERRNEDGDTLLLAACRDPSMFSRMVKVHGKDSPLGELLLERGADPRAVDKSNRNALHLLMQSLQDEYWSYVPPLSHSSLKMLLAQWPVEILSHRADETIRHDDSVDTLSTVLHCALQNVVNQRFARDAKNRRPNRRELDDDDSEAIIGLLLDSGSDPKAVSGEGNTALHILAQGMEWRPASRRLFETFVRLGVDINATNKAGETPLYIFMKGSTAPIWDDISKDTLRPLVLGIKDEDGAWKVFTDNGADFQTHDHEGRCLLHALTYSEEARVGRFKRLVEEMGLDPFTQDNKMRTSLDIAVACGIDGIVNLFKGGSGESWRGKREEEIEKSQ
ncbi:ankyrin-2 [Rhypophila sp. PSN 637]